MSPEERDEFYDRLRKLIRKVFRQELKNQRAKRRKRVFYTPNEFAAKEGVDPNHVRFWLREGQILGARLNDNRTGPHPEWRIAEVERLRYEAEGLFPRYSIEAFAKELANLKPSLSVDTLVVLVRQWCESGAIIAKQCPNGLRIGSDQLKRFVKEKYWPREAA